MLIIKIRLSAIVHEMESDDLRPWGLGRRDVLAGEGTEAGPSVAMEESVVDNSWLGRAEQKHSIFLSHSGAQKAFVRRLRNALVCNAYLPFFDEHPDCLPKGEPFVQRLKEAARLADVAVVVLSDEFFNSKWPMIELGIFTEEQKRRRSVVGCRELSILPLFMGVSVDEFRNRERRRLWLEKWHELGATDSRIDASAWGEAVGVLGGINGIKYSDFRTEEEYIDSIVSAIFKLVPPDVKWEDTHVKGKLKLHQAVADMFANAPSRTRFHNVRTIGLYGMGGIGKTTICKSLCNDYFAEFKGKVWHVELGKKGVEEIQKDVLRHLVGISESLLNQTVKCKDQWRSLLRRKIEYKVFLAIDNVWNEDIYREQAEALLELGYHPESLVIVTSRSRDLLEWLGIRKECCFETPGLDKSDATAVVLQSAAPGYDIRSMSDNQRVAVDKVVERCFLTKGFISCTGSEKQYVPLALEVLGRQLRLPLGGSSAELTKWVERLDLKQCKQKRHPIFSVLQLSYDNLPSSKHKSIFLDAALCAPKQQDNTSASVNDVCKWLSMVYRVDIDDTLELLKDLERDGLVQRWEDLASPFAIHELYIEFAKAEACKEGKSDKRLYLYHEDGLYVPAIMQVVPKHSYWQLRRVHFYNGGFSKLSSEELRYMVHVEVLKLDFCFELVSVDVRCLSSLRSLELRGCFELRMVEGLKEVKHLKFFRWNTCRISGVALDLPETLEIVEIYGSKESDGPATGSLAECVELMELTLSRHVLLAAVPNLCKLHKLQKVDFSGCCRIEELRGLEDLRHLKHLNLSNCAKLRQFLFIEKLVTIETLNLEGCGTMHEEMWDLTDLISLRRINIGGSLVVRELAFNSPHLEQLGVEGCDNLRNVVLFTDSWKCLKRLNAEWALIARNWSFECRSIGDRDSFGGYKTLNFLDYDTLPSLGDIRSLRSLQHLCIHNCRMLTSQPDVWDLSELTNLRRIDLSGNDVVRELVLGSPELEELNVEGCPNLRTVVLCNNSWECLHQLNDHWLGSERSGLNGQFYRVFTFCGLSSEEGSFNMGLDDGDESGEDYLNMGLDDGDESGEDYLNMGLDDGDGSGEDYLNMGLDDGDESGEDYLNMVLDDDGKDSLKEFHGDGSSDEEPFNNVVHDEERFDEESFNKGVRDEERSDEEPCNKEFYDGGGSDEEPCNKEFYDGGGSDEESLNMGPHDAECSDEEFFDRVLPWKREPQGWTYECRSLVNCDAFSAYKILNFANCHTLERLGNIGSLRSLKFLCLQNCKMLRTMPILADSPLLKVVDLSFCSMLEDVSEIGSLRSLEGLFLLNCRMLRTLPNLSDLPLLSILDLSWCSLLEDLGVIASLRSLEYLFLQNCRMLRTLPNLSDLPLLKVVDLSSTSMLEDLGDIGPLMALENLMLRDCESLTSLGDLDHFPLLRELDVKGCVNLRAFSQMTTPDVWDLRMLVKLRSINISGIDVVRELVFGSPHLKKLNVEGCANLRTVVLLANSWECLHRLNELDRLNDRWGEGPRWWTFQCQSVVDCNSFEAHRILNLANCHTLESLGDIGALRSLEELILCNCRMLRTLPNLSDMPCLRVVDLSCCSKLEDLSDAGRMSKLEYLYLRGCGSLKSLKDLDSPSLQLLDLSGCSKLESLGDCDSLRSLRWLDLTYCVSLVNLPILSNFPLLEVLDVTGCANISAFSDITTTNLVIDVSRCEMLTEFLVKDGFVRNEVDVALDEDTSSAVLETVRKWKLHCESRSASEISDPTWNEKVREDWEEWVKCGNMSAEPHGKAETLELLCTSGNEVDILYQQKIFIGEHPFVRLRQYTFPSSLLSAMSRECFVSCTHVRNWFGSLVGFSCCCLP